MLTFAALSTVSAGCPDDDEEPPRPDAGMADGGGGGEARRIIVRADEYDFDPELIYAQPGEELIIELWNVGRDRHSIELELDDEIELPSPVDPDETGILRLTVPDREADFTFYCPIGNHRQLGMTGTLRVERAPAAMLTEVASGFTAPLGLAAPDDGSGRIFVIDQPGRIFMVPLMGARPDEPFLDLRDRIVSLDPSFDERGLLGLAFHPEFMTNGRLFVFYSAPLRDEAPAGYSHTNVLAEYLVTSATATAADPRTERVLLYLDHPQFNHNGGTLAFGPDGYLYLSLGDGGGARDVGVGHTPGLGNAQDTTNLHGSILRIDVDTGDPYGIPADNPFVGQAGLDEIWAYGFRNPYRMSFDRDDGTLYAGDAGEELYEEIDRVTKGGNYGWNLREGLHCFDPTMPRMPPARCADTGAAGEPLIEPIIELPNARLEGGAGTVVIGGFVYRGTRAPALAGQYIFGMWSAEGDRAAGTLYAASRPIDPDDVWSVRPLAISGSDDDTLGAYLLGFGEGPEGELYIFTTGSAGPSGTSGRMWRFAGAEMN